MEGNPRSIGIPLPERAERQRHVLPYERGEALGYWLRQYEVEKERAFIGGIDRCLPKEQKRLLDMGCGTGLHTALWGERGKEVTAADFSTVFGEHIWRTYPFPFIWTDVLHCTIREQYDICFCMALATLLLDQASRFRTFETLSGLVRPGGFLVLVTSSNQWPFELAAGRRERLHCLDEVDLERLEVVLFEIQRVFYWSSTPKGWWRSPLSRGVVKIAERVATQLGIGARKVVICRRRPFEGHAMCGY